jgi:hypothetical protein
MTELAARLDPCVNWFKLLARTKGRILWLFPALLLAGYLASLRFGDAASGFLDRFHERSSNAPLLAEARGLNLGYERVLAEPKSYVGKPVVWCVDTPAVNVSYVAGRPGWPVALNGSYDEYRTNGGGSASYCFKVLAVITGFERGLIQLRPVEKL